MNPRKAQRFGFKTSATLALFIFVFALVAQANAAPASRMPSIRRSMPSYSQTTLEVSSAVLTPELDGSRIGHKSGQVGSRRLHHGSHRKRSFSDIEEKEDLGNYDDEAQLFARNQASWALGINRIIDAKNSRPSKHHHHHHKPQSNSSVISSTRAANRKAKIHENLRLLQSSLHDSKGLKGGSSKSSEPAAMVSGNQVQFLAQQSDGGNIKSASQNGINLNFTLEKLSQFKSKWNTEADTAKSSSNGTISHSGVIPESSSISNSTGRIDEQMKHSGPIASSSGASFRVSEGDRADSVAQAAAEASVTSHYGSWQVGEVPSAATLGHGSDVPIISTDNKTSSPSRSAGRTSQSLLSKSAGLSGPKAVVMLLTSNDENYGPSAVLSDLRALQKWADDVGSLTEAQESEVVAAILSASARYFPELPTKMISRVLLADMKAESDFEPTLVSPGRLDSGSSYGLLQISPGNGSQELSLFKSHVVTTTSKRSWVMEASAKNVISNGKYDASNGRNPDNPLLDWKTGQRLLAADLSTKDLFRPWVNIHTAAWIQSNLARSKSQDPDNWKQINKNSAYVQTLANSLSKISTKSDSRTTTANALYKAINILDDSIEGDSLTANINSTVATALGSWVAGPASTGEGSYLQKGDDISAQYLKAVMSGVEHLYGKKLGVQWLETLKLNKGLVDFH